MIPQYAPSLHDWMRTVASEVNPAIFTAGPPSAVAGSSAKVDWLRDDPAFPLANEGSIWSGAVYFGHGLNKTFGANDGQAGSPCATIFSFANNNGSPGDVSAIIGSAVARANNSSVFGANFIARGTGNSGCKFTGMEIDVEPAVGDTAISSASGGIFLNIFNKAISGPAFQIGGINGGTFGNGIVLGGLAAAAAGLSLQGSADSLTNATVGTFTTAAHILGSGASKSFRWASGGASIYYDSLNQRQVLPSGGAWVIRDSTDTTSLVAFDSGGNISPSGTILFAAGQSSTTATTGAQTLPANPVGFLTVSIGGTSRKLPYYAT